MIKEVRVTVSEQLRNEIESAFVPQMEQEQRQTNELWRKHGQKLALKYIQAAKKTQNKDLNLKHEGD